MINRLRVRTKVGPVGLQERRKEKQQITVPEAGVGVKTIAKNWLATADEKLYHHCIKQAMLISARMVELNDCLDPYFQSATDPRMVQEQIQQIKSGQIKVSVHGHRKMQMKKIARLADRERYLLIKFSKRCCCDRRERSFIIENGELMIYRTPSKNSKISYPTYKLKDAQVFVENRVPGSLVKPRFEVGYQDRLKVVFPERTAQQKTPFYLYPKDKEMLKSWKRAFQLARVLVSDNDRRAMKISIGQAASARLKVGYEALRTYFMEIDQTRKLVRQMALRLMKVDFARGWTKMRLVNRKINDAKRKRNDQQLWAARFMSEKLARLGTQQAKKASDVRETVVTRIQQRFRLYREEKIFDRQYPIGADKISRMRQARQGINLDVALEVCTCEEVLLLSLSDKRSIDKFKLSPDMLQTKRSTYSEVNIPAAEMLLSVSDNLQSLAFTAPTHAADAWANLAKSDWSNFISLDRISQVVLHSAPHPGVKRTTAQDYGVWCTIYGPRVGWGKRIDVTYKDGKQASSVPVGTADGFMVPKALGDKFAVKREPHDQQGTRIKWVTIVVSVDGEPSWSNEETPQQPTPESQLKTKGTYLSLHVLGFRFTSKLVTDGSRSYANTFNGPCKARVPVANDDAALVALDNGTIGVEIIEVKESPNGVKVKKKDPEKLLLVGSENLWHVLKPSGNGNRSESIKGVKKCEILLAAPDTHEGVPKARGRINLALNVTIEDNSANVHDVSCVSPEFIGCGSLTSLFTSHRGAWFDNELGPGQFRLDHVANFVELNLSGLRFPPTDPGPTADGPTPTYRIRATLAGITSVTPPLHRCKDRWAHVLGASLADPFVIKFNGCRLILPLPPGCWGGEKDHRPRLEIEVVKGDHLQTQSMSYFDFEKSEGRSRSQSVKEEVVYRTLVIFDGLLVDQERQISAFFAKGSKRTDSVVIDAFTNMVKRGNSTEAVLNFDFALRDRDYIKGTVKDPGEQRTIFVGDKAMMVTEEPLTYPQTKQEFRSRFCAGSFDAEKKQWKDTKRGAQLREPCLSSEYASSGLGDITPKVPFKQSFIPNYCYDILPHKFVCPLTEQQFRQERRPGIWPYILDDLSEQKAKTGTPVSQRAPARTVVTHLSHISRQIPVTLLACYPDGTADVELAPGFMEGWKKQPEKRYALPGTLLRAEPGPAKPTKPGEAPKQPALRAILQKVPVVLLNAVHAAGFHVYDADSASIQDLKRRPPPQNDFNPRTWSKHSDTVQPFNISAGPMPGDASTAACQYEWSLHVRSPSEQQMQEFIATLRQCVRIDHFQQSSKMVTYKNTNEPGLVEMPPQLKKQLVGGQLEVVLVEARRLRPVGFGNTVHEVKQSIPGLAKKYGPLHEDRIQGLQAVTAGEPSKSTPDGSEISTFVNFRMKHNNETIPFKSHKVQQSPVIPDTDSPNWATVENLISAGGWTFKTGLIDPDKLPDLVIEFEVMSYHTAFSQVIGAIQLGVTQRPFLTNPKEPFRNLWLPLLSEKDGRVIPNKTGEIHIMTRWLPCEKLYLPPGQQQVTVRSHFLKELWPKVCAQRLKEPIYGLEAQFLNYNPNLVRKNWPETPADYVRRHTEEMYNTVPYLECLERRQIKLWEAFEKRLAEEGSANIRLGELRLKWINDEDTSHLSQLQELLEAGVPSARREKFWLEITLAKRVMELDGVGGRRTEKDPETIRRASEADYQQLLELGLPQNSDANKQLQEDAFHLASWESSTPPVPELLDWHLRRLKKAQNVCTALIAFEKGGIAYCESLLVLAFFLLLPQGFREEKSVDDGNITYLSESSCFWLIYTLVGTRVNGTFKEYYGKPQPFPREGEEDAPAQAALCVSSGAMQDVTLLDCCLAYHEHDLWQKLNALGFQLSTVFYGAFMRLFATYMPTATVFRFWDILFSQSADPKAQPHARAYLIDLAFGLMRAKKRSLIACESALEVKTLLLGLFGSLYDTSTVIELTVHAHKFLWGGGGFSFGKVGHLWTQRESMFQSLNETTHEQNEILRILTHEKGLGKIPQTRYESPQGAKGVTTKELLKDVLPVMQQAFETLRPRTHGTSRYWAMHRPMPLAARMLCENTLEKAWTLLTATIRGNNLPPLPTMVGPPDGTSGASRPYPGLEPLDITASDMTTVLGKDIPAWSPLSQQLWKAFTNRRDLHMQWRQADLDPSAGAPGGMVTNQPQWMNFLFQNKQQQDLARIQQANQGVKEHISLNELFIALICCSRGTLGEKASALFNIYSYVEARNSPPVHMTPISRLAKSITKSGDGSGEHMGKNLTPPDPETTVQNALHFQVWSNFPHKHTLVGEVFVPTLGSFVGYDPNEAELQSYNIWGPYSNLRVRKNQQGYGNQAGAAGTPPSNADKVVVGEMEMAITWTPKTIKNPEVGQLCIRLKGIRFFKMYVSDFFKMNPKVTVNTYDNGRKVDIKRWEPRRLMNNDLHQSWLTTSGAYGGNIEFEHTMREGLIGHGEHFHHWLRHGSDMGFNPDTEEWVWNETWGKQFSVEDFRFQNTFMALSQRKNVMDMHGVRLIVIGILNRSMLNVTNRQALLIADSLFNRSGAVPGILEAVIANTTNPRPKEGMPDPEQSLKKLRDQWGKSRVQTTDVTNAIVLEHERQIQRFGFLNLFHPDFLRSMPQGMLTLKDMNIQDPYPNVAKSMWIRYVRGGDGERCTQGVLLNGSGKIEETPHPEIKLDLSDSWPQTKVTKEEFISCLLHSPLLGESLRRIGATDHVLHPRRSIPLDVTIMDPHQEEQSTEFMDAINVQQSVLLEVWDSDIGAKDFLGEAWLPPLANLTSVPKDHVLQLKAADFSGESEYGQSREAKHKFEEKEAEEAEKKGKENRKVTGELYVTLAWKYPAYEMNEKNECTPRDSPGFSETITNRAQIQEKLHTGRLTLELKRAVHLRRADAAKGRDCDPAVIAWVRNDVLMAKGENCWRKKPLARSSVVRNNRNPKWNNEFKESPFDIMTGSYEARFPPKGEGWFEELKATFRMPRQRRYLKEERELTALKRFGSTGLRLKFYEEVKDAPSSNEGENHKVEVFLGDTIREFKAKLTVACDKEAQYWAEKAGGQAGAATDLKYQDVVIGYKHLVMVFVPSPKVQRLYAQKKHEGTEYKHAYNQAIQDPSSWQPLDPTRTFGQYPQFGFGRKQPQLLRIVEATESYKLLNLRYKEFDRDLSKRPFQDTDETDRCFGWAKYWHPYDQSRGAPAGRDHEWRPAFVMKHAVDPAQFKYKIEWIFKSATEDRAGGASTKNVHDGRDVLLAPRSPLIEVYVHPDHKEFLEQAKTLRTMGKSDWEIEAMLNKSLQERQAKESKDGSVSGDRPPPPPITVDVIRSYMQHRDADEAAKKHSADASQKAIQAK